MRRKQALWGRWAVPVLVAGFVGYLVVGWYPSASHNRELSAAQTVALRFPQDSADDIVSSVMSASIAQTNQAQPSLLDPQPMAPSASAAPASIRAAAADDTQVVGPPMQLHMAALDQPARAPVVGASAQQASSPAAQPSAAKPASAPRQSIASAAQAKVAQLAAAAHRALNERPGFLLNDAQIASIKQRLHLTPDQEEMWPAVEAALRNLAYTRAREARSKGPAANVQIAQADPNSPEVQGLKSAAIPLLMSFNSEQKDEVRNLAHVMGLDQLASQF
jgi:zinc resistance-associated protein